MKHTIKNLTITEQSKPFPDAKLGDILYYSEFYEGVYEFIVIGKNEDGFCLVVNPRGDLKSPVESRISDVKMYSTRKEAVTISTDIFMENHREEGEYVQRVRLELDRGGDLCQFDGGWAGE